MQTNYDVRVEMPQSMYENEFFAVIKDDSKRKVSFRLLLDSLCFPFNLNTCIENLNQQDQCDYYNRIMPSFSDYYKKELYVYVAKCQVLGRAP